MFINVNFNWKTALHIMHQGFGIHSLGKSDWLYFYWQLQEVCEITFVWPPFSTLNQCFWSLKTPYNVQEFKLCHYGFCWWFWIELTICEWPTYQPIACVKPLSTCIYYVGSHKECSLWWKTTLSNIRKQNGEERSKNVQKNK